MAGKIAQAALEFQPDAAEIEQSPAPLAARATLYVLLAAILAAIAWASLAKVDRVVSAHGKLVTTAQTLTVQPLETSIVRSIEHRLGDVVHKGETLATLDATFSGADAAQLRDKAASLAAEVTRLEAEIADRPYDVDPATADAEERLQHTIYLKQRAGYAAKLEALDRDIDKALAGIATKRADREALATRLDVARELESMRAKLYEKDIGSKINLLDARSTRVEVERNLQLAGNELLELQQAEAKARADREAFIEEWREKAAEELVTARRDYDAASKDLEKATRRNAMVVLTAPADAIVLDMAQRSVGSVLKEAEPLFTLVPLDVPLEAEVMVDAQDIGNVPPDAEVRLKLDAFPYQKHGTIDGRLRTISDDTFDDKDREKVTGSYYRGRVQLLSTGLRDVPASFHLIPGMTVTAEIKSGTRTVLSYFLYPLLRGVSESIREP